LTRDFAPLPGAANIRQTHDEATSSDVSGSKP
jgi:hypothetical protein